MKLRLRNFKGIAAGPSLTWDGLPEIEIDFAGKAGMISLSGENGAGKSTVLENLHHYPQLVSRDGALWSHCTGREAEKEFISTFMGREYRSVIKMDAEQGKQEGYLWVDGKPVCNGKITNFKEQVNAIFGQPFTYFRSQFCPQKSRKTSGMQIENMTAGVFRELLREFLNLQRYAEWEDTAKQAAGHYQGQLSGLELRRSVLQDTAGQREGAEGDAALAKNHLGIKQDEFAIFKQGVVDKRATIDTLKATIAANALALERRADIQRQIDRQREETAKEKQVVDGEIAVLGEKWRTLNGEIKAQDAILKDREAIEKAAGEKALAENDALDLQGKIDHINQDVPKHQQAVHDLETQLAALKAQVKDLATDPENLRLGKLVDEAERAVKEKEQEITALDNDFQLAALQAEIKSLERAAVVGVGIDSTCQSVTCAAIKSVNEANEKLPLAQASLTTRKEEMKVILAGLLSAVETIKVDTAKVLEEKGRRVKWVEDWNRDAAEEITTLAHDLKNAQQIVLSANEMLTHHRATLATKRAEIAKQKALADRLPEIRIAEGRKADLEKQLAEVTAQGSEKKAAWEARAKEAGDKLQFSLGALAAYRIDETADAALLAAQKEIVEIETVLIPAVEAEIQAAREKIATLQAELARIQAAEKELDEVQVERAHLTRSMGSWRYLQFGCSKTGLQNLRIDGAAPRIVYNANRLLSQAYGALYSIRLETINDEGKEDLRIKIIMENGQEVYLDDISGGQRTWCVQSLWLAMSLLNQEKGGKKFDYFCADEADGALDPENAERFTALYRPFMAEGRLEQLLYISHKPSCRAMADNVLIFEAGKNPAWG